MMLVSYIKDDTCYSNSISFQQVSMRCCSSYNTVGNTDGLIKGKRYFTCPLKHGKVVRISDIVAVLPRAVSIVLIVLFNKIKYCVFLSTPFYRVHTSSQFKGPIKEVLTPCHRKGLPVSKCLDFSV